MWTGLCGSRFGPLATLVNSVMNLRFSYKTENFITSLVAIVSLKKKKKRFFPPWSQIIIQLVRKQRIFNTRNTKAHTAVHLDPLIYPLCITETWFTKIRFYVRLTNSSWSSEQSFSVGFFGQNYPCVSCCYIFSNRDIYFLTNLTAV